MSPSAAITEVFHLHGLGHCEFGVVINVVGDYVSHVSREQSGFFEPGTPKQSKRMIYRLQRMSQLSLVREDELCSSSSCIKSLIPPLWRSLHNI